jgi:hypothetical protein
LIINIAEKSKHYPPQNFVGEKVIDELNFDVYPGNGDY